MKKLLKFIVEIMARTIEVIGFLFIVIAIILASIIHPLYWLLIGNSFITVAFDYAEEVNYKYFEIKYKLLKNL